MFADRLRATRMYRGYTLQQISDSLGIPMHTYQHYEGARRRPDYMTILEIAKFLDVSIDFLLGNDEYLQKMGWQVDIPLDVPPRRGQK